MRHRDSWQGQRKHYEKPQKKQPPPTNQHTPTTAGLHTEHKAVYLLVRRNILLAEEAVLAGARVRNTQINAHVAVKRQRLGSTSACQLPLAG